MCEEVKKAAAWDALLEEWPGGIEEIESAMRTSKERADRIANLERMLGMQREVLEALDGFVAETEHTEECAEHCYADHDWSNCICGKKELLSRIKKALDEVEEATITYDSMVGAQALRDARDKFCGVTAFNFIHSEDQAQEDWRYYRQAADELDLMANELEGK